MRTALLKLARAVIPLRVRRALSNAATWPPRGAVRFGSLRRLTPISDEWGHDRGTPIDRHYIEQFLSLHAQCVTGTVLEIGTAMYTRRFGADRVERSEVLHVAERLPEVTVIGDLAHPDLFPKNTFDCILLTQTLQCIYDVRAAVDNCHRYLKPGGTLLATFPGISQISQWDMDRWGYHWSFTTRSASRMFGDAFESGDVEVVAYGNVLTSISFLHGLASQELTARELEYHDPGYQLLIGVRATKAPAP